MATMCSHSSNSEHFSLELGTPPVYRTTGKSGWLDSARNVGDAGEAHASIPLIRGPNRRLRADRAIVDLKRQYAPVLELELTTKERLRLEHAAIRCPGRYQQLHLAAPNTDVDSLVALSVVIQRLRWITSWLTHKRLLHVASLHGSTTVRRKYARVHSGDQMRTLEFEPSAWTLTLVDQTRLPRETVFVVCRTVDDVAHAIRSMRVRGAPAIGVAAAYGMALAAHASVDLEQAAKLLGATRPTAVNLQWALDRMLANARGGANAATLLALANEMADEDVAVNKRIGAFGLDLVPQHANVLTHCNAGALATVDYGTALGVVRAAHEAGRGVHVFVDETRPFLQGARLTTWELQQAGVPLTLITDNMAGHFMHRGKVDLVVVGADRIAANGDVANKIGTYSLAVLAHENGVPFYVAAPLSTIDLSVASGDAIPIEERSSHEVTHIQGVAIAPDGVEAAHPAFDITPARYVTAIITERGVLRAPYTEALAKAVKALDQLVA